MLANTIWQEAQELLLHEFTSKQEKYSAWQLPLEDNARLVVAVMVQMAHKQLKEQTASSVVEEIVSSANQKRIIKGNIEDHPIYNFAEVIMTGLQAISEGGSLEDTYPGYQMITNAISDYKNLQQISRRAA